MEEIKMKGLMNCCMLVLITVASLDALGQTENDSVIYWQQDVKLSWNDFKGKIPDKSGHTTALSSIEIKTKARWLFGMPDYSVFATFHKYSSWTKDDTSLYLLQHEQLHFDIEALYVRKIRAVMNELRSKGVSDAKPYLKVFRQLTRQCNEMELLYDMETEHGTNRNKQASWNMKIAAKLSRQIE